MKEKISETDFEAVCDVIKSKLGLEFHIGRHSTVIRNLTMAAVEFGFVDFDEFVNWLLKDELKKGEIEKLASFLTVSETFFWREPNVFSALTDYILPELVRLKKDGDKTIRIWSVGCSSGEEPYSIAIALLRTIQNIKEWNIKILATDINPKALEKAEKGIYTKWSFRNCPSWLKDGYFKSLEKDRSAILPKIKEMVTFQNLNLTEDSFPSFMNDTHAMDIIFCRNVLMYFSDEWVNKISHQLFNSLNRDGWFVVASCELSSHVFSQYNTVNFKDAILYRKGDKVLAIPGIIKDKSGEVVKEKQEARQSSVTGGKFNPFMEAEPFENMILPETVLENNSIFVQKAEPESVHGVIAIMDVSSKVRMFANKGELKEALLLCNEGIADDKLSIVLYSLRASILQEMDMHSDAIASFKQAIYLDPDFVMGHFALGNLFIREKKIKNARMYFNNVLDLIRPLDNDDLIPESDGLSVKNIRNIIMDNLQNHKMI